MSYPRSHPLSWRALAASCALLAACVSRAPDVALAATPTAIWPPDGGTPRIGFLGSLPAARVATLPWWRIAWSVIAGIDDAGPDVASLQRPFGLAVRDNVLWVADPDASAVWRIDLETNELRPTRCQGSSSFGYPIAVAAGPAGELFVADAGAHQIVVVGERGDCLRTFAAADLVRPTDVAWFEERGVLAVADPGQHVVVLLDRHGAVLGTIGGRGTADADFNFPTHVAKGADGSLFVLDALNYKVKRFDVASRRLLGAFGAAGDAAGLFQKPKGLDVDSEGHVYVCEAMRDEVYVFEPSGEFLLAFAGEPGSPAGLSLPAGIAIDDRDRIFVADSMNKRVQVYRYLRAASAP